MMPAGHYPNTANYCLSDKLVNYSDNYFFFWLFEVCEEPGAVKRQALIFVPRAGLEPAQPLLAKGF